MAKKVALIHSKMMPHHESAKVCLSKNQIVLFFVVVERYLTQNTTIGRSLTLQFETSMILLKYSFFNFFGLFSASGIKCEMVSC